MAARAINGNNSRPFTSTGDVRILKRIVQKSHNAVNSFSSTHSFRNEFILISITLVIMLYISVNWHKEKLKSILFPEALKLNFLNNVSDTSYSFTLELLVRYFTYINRNDFCENLGKLINLPGSLHSQSRKKKSISAAHQ